MIDRSVEQARFISMFNSNNDKPTLMKIAVAATFIAALTLSPFAVAQGHEHGSDTAASKEVTGEVVDMSVTSITTLSARSTGNLAGPSASRAAVGRDRQRRQSVSGRRRT